MVFFYGFYHTTFVSVGYITKMAVKAASTGGARSRNNSDNLSPSRNVDFIPDSEIRCQYCKKPPAHESDKFERCSKCNAPYHVKCKAQAELMELSCRRCVFAAKVVKPNDTSQVTGSKDSVPLDHLNKLIGGLESRLGKCIASTSSELKKEIKTDIAALCASMDNRISLVEQKVDGVQAETSDLKADVTKLQGELNFLKANLDLALDTVKNEAATLCYKELMERTA